MAFHYKALIVESFTITKNWHLLRNFDINYLIPIKDDFPRLLGLSCF